MATLLETIEKFVSKQANYYGYKKTTIDNLLLGNKELYDSKFLTLLSDDLNSETVDSQKFALAVKESVMSYSSNKDSAIDIFKHLQQFVEKEMKCSITVDYPPIPVSNTFERLMFISKYFHDEKHTVEDLQDILWQSGRTIEADLAKLRGMDGDPLQICGKQFVIREMERDNGKFHFESTVHPFFLTANLTQVVAMLKGLDELAKKPEWRGYTDITSRQIWQQLSDYGKARAKYVMTNLLPEDARIVEKLEATANTSFYNEIECSNCGGNGLLMAMKNGCPAYVEYQTENGSEFLEHVRFISFGEEGTLVVEIDGKIRVLEERRILKSSMEKEGLF